MLSSLPFTAAVTLSLGVAGAPAADVDARTLTQVIAAAAGTVPGVEVVTTADLRSVVELQGEREALASCNPTETASCLAEVAAAFGARYALASELGSLGSERTLSLNVLDTSRAMSLGRVVIRGADVAALSHAADDAVPSIVAGLVTAGAGMRLLVLDVGSAGSLDRAETNLATTTPRTPWFLIGGGATALFGVGALAATIAGDVYVDGLQQQLDLDGERRLSQSEALELYDQRDQIAQFVKAGYVVGPLLIATGATMVIVDVVSEE